MPTDQLFTLIFSPLTIRRKGRIGSFSFQVMRISSVLMRVFSCSFLNRFHVSSSLKCLKIFTVFSRFYENLAIFSERGVAVFANPSESKELVITPQYAHGQISSIHIAFTAITPASLYAYSKYRHSSLFHQLEFVNHHPRIKAPGSAAGNLVDQHGEGFTWSVIPPSGKPSCGPRSPPVSNRSGR